MKKITGYLIIAIIAGGLVWVECQAHGVKQVLISLFTLIVVVAALFKAMDLIEGR